MKAKEKIHFKQSWFQVILTGILLILLADTALAVVPDRRKEQFPGESAFYVIPFPYVYPGIGSGILGMVNFSNIGGSRADVTGGVITGDVSGQFLFLGEAFIIPNYVYIGGGFQNINRVTVQNYDQRGMDSDKDEFTYIEATELNSKELQVNLTLWERRIELFQYQNTQTITVPRIYDSEGNLIADLSEPYHQESKTTIAGAILDLTDDHQDPRAGLRLKWNRIDQPRQNQYSPDFYTVNQTAEAYVPLGKLSTWAFHYMRSDAVVTDPGPTDDATLLQLIGLECNGDALCQETQAKLLEQFRNQNQNGTSQSLGGLDQLRSYGQQRFQGAHTLYYSSELRLNLTEEFTPFDYWIWSDTRTGVQLALFYETGSVSETKETLGDETRSSYGGGLRMVTGSGFVYRIDVASGDEGTVPIIWFFYPW